MSHSLQGYLRARKIFKVRHVTLTMPLLGTVCYRRLGHTMINLPTKFEVPYFTRYGNMKGVAKCT